MSTVYIVYLIDVLAMVFKVKAVMCQCILEHLSGDFIPSRYPGLDEPMKLVP
jgi:hypothetical protein